MRVLITGSRQWLDRSAMNARLDAAYVEWKHKILRSGELGDVFTIIHGAAAGADTMAGEWVFDRRHEEIPPAVEVHPADWNRYGVSMAGKIRNVEMIRLGADMVIGFFQASAANVGTRHCIAEAHRWLDHLGVPIEEIWSRV